MNFEKNATPEWFVEASQYLEELKGKSKYQHEKVSDTVEKIHSPERGDFVLEKIRDPKSKEAKDVFNLTKKFAPEEADTVDIIQDAIANPTEAYSYHVAKEGKKTVAFAQSSYLELRPEAGGKPNEVAIFGGFSLTAESYRRKGIGAELVSQLIKEDVEKAQKRGQEIKCFTVEGKETSESFWNHVGLKRLYYEDAEGNFNEAPYIQPPIQWDEETGRALDPETEEIGDKDIKEYTVPEHLMIKMMDKRNEINLEELKPVIDIIYFDNYTLYRNEGEKFPTDEAIKYTQDAVNKFLDEFFETLKNSKDGKLYLMDAKEREEKRKELEVKGKSFNELIVEKENEE